MRFDRIRIEAFGPLSSLDTGPDPLPSLVVVQAPNEGGKSSFFRALSSILYGFYPASRERHPYAPWSGTDAEIEVRLSGHDGTVVRVHRRLLSSPWGRVTREDEVSDIANRTLPWAAHVRRELFGSVFALTLGDLTRVDEESWEEIQDRLLGAMGAEDLRSPRNVVEELEKEAASLWRDDRLGKPEARVLQDRLRELDEERREARERDRHIREGARKLEELRKGLDQTKEERQRAEAFVERARTLGPVRSELLRIEEARDRAGDLEELRDLPPDPGDRLRELEESSDKLRSEIDELEKRARDLAERAESVTEADGRLLQRATRIRALSKMAGEVSMARRQLPVLDERESGVRRRCREAARQLFAAPWESVDDDRIRALPMAELRTRTRQQQKRAREVSTLEGRRTDLRRETPEPTSSRLPVLGGVTGLVLVGLGLLLWGLLARPGAIDGSGTLAVVAGATMLLAAIVWISIRVAEQRLRSRERANRKRQLEEVDRKLREERRKLEEAREGVQDLLDGLPVADHLVDDPDSELLRLLADLQDHLEDDGEIRRKREELARLVEDAERRLRKTAEEMVEDLPDDFLSAVAALEARLEEATTRDAEARAAGESLAESRRTLEGLREREERERTRLLRLRTRLSDLGDGDPGRGLERARTRIEARDRARTFQEDLERRHPELDDLRRRIAEAEDRGEEWTTDEEAVIRARDRARELNEREKEIIAEIHDREADLRELGKRTTLDRVESEILQVRESLEEIRRRRDRLALLAGVIREADRRFRDRNQPDLLRTAGQYLETITDGRYRRLRMEEGRMSGTLYLEGPGYPHAMEVASPVSTGTREQVYLALRLAIIDHLDAGSERLPIFLDEAFVNWDARRRERAFTLLAEVAHERQVFVFTCHEPMARELEETGGRLFRLDGPE